MDKSINTVTYRKKVAGNTIVSAKSCHPLQTIKAIPCGEMTRAKINCSVTSELEMNTVCDRLKTWGCATWMLDQAKSRVRSTPREQLLLESETIGCKQNRQQCMVLSTPFSSEFKYILDIILRYLPYLDLDPAFSEILKGGCKIVAQKGNYFGQYASPEPCSDQPSCNTHLAQPSNAVTIFASAAVLSTYLTRLSMCTQRSYKIKHYINCNTSYIVYLMSCSLCNEQYVGSTKCCLKTRIRCHLSVVRISPLSQVSAVSLHCIQKHNCDTSSISVQGLERVMKPVRGGDYVKKLQSRESYWIFVLRAYQPNGMNR